MKFSKIPIVSILLKTGQIIRGVYGYDYGERKSQIVNPVTFLEEDFPDAELIKNEGIIVFSPSQLFAYGRGSYQNDAMRRFLDGCNEH